MNYVKRVVERTSKSLREVHYIREDALTYWEAEPNSLCKMLYADVIIDETGTLLKSRHTGVRQSVSTFERIKRLFLSRAA